VNNLEGKLNKNDNPGGEISSVEEEIEPTVKIVTTLEATKRVLVPIKEIKVTTFDKKRKTEYLEEISLLRDVPPKILRKVMKVEHREASPPVIPKTNRSIRKRERSTSPLPSNPSHIPPVPIQDPNLETTALDVQDSVLLKTRRKKIKKKT